jgi:hypothetical protein
MEFFPGDQLEKIFFLEVDGEAVEISEVSGVLYETKQPTRIIHTFEDGTATAPTQVDATHVKFTFTPEVTLKCRPGIHLTFDVWVGNKLRTWTGDFGTPGFSPITAIIQAQIPS